MDVERVEGVGEEVAKAIDAPSDANWVGKGSLQFSITASVTASTIALDWCLVDHFDYDSETM